MNRIEKLKKVILKYLKSADCGMFFTRNFMGDAMTTVYQEDGITVDVCYEWGYFEIFGLTQEEQEEIEKFYSDCRRDLLHL